MLAAHTFCRRHVATTLTTANAVKKRNKYSSNITSAKSQNASQAQLYITCFKILLVVKCGLICVGGQRTRAIPTCLN